MVYEKENFTREVAGKHKVIFILLKITKKYQISCRKKAKCYSVLCYFQIFYNFEDTFAVFPLAYSMLNSHV